MTFLKLFFSVFLVQSIFVAHAMPTRLKPESVYVADNRKTKAYLYDGMVTGGDRAIDDALVLGIRHAFNKGFERMVIDLEGNRNGEPTAIERPPYYQVAVSPEYKRVTFTVWGKPKLAFDSKKVVRSFKKSKLVKRVELLPLLEKDRWMFSLEFRREPKIEVFELGSPVRIIVDFKNR